jgi:hypothetical protein
MNETARALLSDASTWTEDLPLNAARGREFGRALCTCDTQYHALWGLLRAAGCTGGLEEEEAVLSPLLARLLAGGKRILIVGAADTGTLCMTARAAKERNADITVLDHCRSPLRLIESFSSEHGLPAHTLHLDVTELGAAASWDVMLLHYTLSFIAPEQRSGVMQRLAHALAPGGTLVCTIRTGQPSLFGLERLETAWIEKMRGKIEQSGLSALTKDGELERLLQKGAKARTERRRTIPTVEETKSLIADSGLRLAEELETPSNYTLPVQSGHDAYIERSMVLTAIRDR